MDNIKIDKPLRTISSAKRVKQVGNRQNNNQRNHFKDAFKDGQKKKKRDDPKHMKISGKDATGKNGHSSQTVTNKKSKESPKKRIIDIRV